MSKQKVKIAHRPQKLVRGRLFYNTKHSDGRAGARRTELSFEQWRATQRQRKALKGQG
jgi:hypothetical protein